MASNRFGQQQQKDEQEMHWWRNGRRRRKRRRRLNPRAAQKLPAQMVASLLCLLIAFLPAGSNAIQFPSGAFSNGQQQQPPGSSTVRSISTPFGVVRGQLVSPPGTPMAEGTPPPVVQFLAIPYGSAPTGHHRFKMAISAPKWTHQPKDAFRPPPACIQSGLPSLSESEALKVTTAQRFDRLHRILPALKPQTEDCLFMNLFVPERRDLRDAQPLSVLVLVHGDTDYGWGGANAYNGTLLASMGRIVVVTLNYRLGVYGFLGRCDPEALHSCAGNAGLTDLVAALKMLSLLLPSFGADPNAVTLLGWESGAALVSLLMASPITQPKGRLFRRAILLDGSALAPWAMGENPQEQFMRLASELKCLGDNPSADSYQKEAARLFHCLQEHSAQNLSAAARKVANQSPTFLSAFAPIIDGQMVPNHPSLSFSPKNGALFREIDLLLGTVQHPAQHLMADQDMQHGLGAERRDKIIRTLVRNIFDFHRTGILHAILNEYTDWENPRNHPKSIRNGLMAALGDLLFTTPLIETARAHSLEEGAMKAANTFFFVFGHETAAWMREQPNSGLRGSFTGDHLPYILGLPFATDDNGGGGTGGVQFSPEDKQLCRVLMTYVANFVKSGDPTRPQPMSAQSSIEDRFQGLPWPQFSSQTREAYLEITDRPRVKNFYRNSFVQFWSGFIPVLNRQGGKDVPEEHHLLPDHFDRSTFFGEPRPFSTYHNIPFPPPPMPPTPFPKELRKQLIASLTLTTKRPPGSGESTAKPAPPTAQSESGSAIQRSEYNPNWGWLILVGVALTVVNLCIFVALSKKCLGRRSESKKKFQYQSYGSPPGHMPPPPGAMDMQFAAMMSGQQQQQSRRSSQYLPAPPRPLSSRQPALDFAEELLDTDNILGNGGGTLVRASITENGCTNQQQRRHSLSLQQKRANPIDGGNATTTTFGGGQTQPQNGPKFQQSEAVQVAQTAGNESDAFGGRTSPIRVAPFVLGKRASAAGMGGRQKPALLNGNNNNSGEEQQQTMPHHRGSGGSHLLLMTQSSCSQRSSLQEQQEPLLSATGSLKGSTPSVVIQPPTAAGLIRLGTGISPTCPRHGRAAQMLLAANQRSAAIPTITSANLVAMQQQQQQQGGTTNGGGNGQKQHLEEVQV